MKTNTNDIQLEVIKNEIRSAILSGELESKLGIIRMKCAELGLTDIETSELIDLVKKESSKTLSIKEDLKRYRLLICAGCIIMIVLEWICFRTIPRSHSKADEKTKIELVEQQYPSSLISQYAIQIKDSIQMSGGQVLSDKTIQNIANEKYTKEKESAIANIKEKQHNAGVGVFRLLLINAISMLIYAFLIAIIYYKNKKSKSVHGTIFI